MQRLFSIFPTGAAGVALIVLRSVVAITVVVDTCRSPVLGSVPIINVFVTSVGLCLVLGFLTPYCAALSCLLELALLVTAGVSSQFHLTMSALTGAGTALLGPGAYSVDARLFGRQLIKIPPKPESQ